MSANMTDEIMNTLLMMKKNVVLNHTKCWISSPVEPSLTMPEYQASGEQAINGLGWIRKV